MNATAAGHGTGVTSLLRAPWPKALVAAGALTGLGLALQPAWADPQIHQVLSLAVQALALSSSLSGCALGVAYVHHRAWRWAAERPVAPAPSLLFSVQQAAGPALAREYAVARAEENQAAGAEDLQRRWQLALIRFCIIGTSQGNMGSRQMCPQHVDRPGWDLITKALSRCQPRVLVMGRGGRPTGFAPGWDCPRLRVSLKRGELRALPCPPAEDLPEVKW